VASAYKASASAVSASAASTSAASSFAASSSAASSSAASRTVVPPRLKMVIEPGRPSEDAVGVLLEEAGLQREAVDKFGDHKLGVDKALQVMYSKSVSLSYDSVVASASLWSRSFGLC
jgi:hypothetical protein